MDPADYTEQDLLPDRWSVEEFKELERDLIALDDCDLGEWDRDFIDDMCRRVMRFKRKVIVSGKQQKQLERMKEQYLE